MGDHRPPKLSSDERETLRVALQYCRDSVVRKATGLGEDDARRSTVPSGTSLLWLLKHLAFAESVWVLGRFAARPDAVRPNEVEPGDTVASAVEGYQRTWREVDGVIEGADLDDVMAGGDDEPVNLRWILVHLIEETARHAGHADLLREQLDGATGR